MAEPKAKGHVGYCYGHGKALYSSRRMARREMRRRHTRGMRAYRCDLVAGHWHCGHLPLAVVAGRLTAAEIYEGSR